MGGSEDQSRNMESPENGETHLQPSFFQEQEEVAQREEMTGFRTQRPYDLRKLPETVGVNLNSLGMGVLASRKSLTNVIAGLDFSGHVVCHLGKSHFLS